MQVTEIYNQFKPPFNMKAVTEELLRYVPQHYLSGLAYVVITESTALNRNERNRRLISRKRKVPMAQVRGLYSAAIANEPAYITLYADKICNDIPSVWLPIIRLIVLSDVLYHEIGHHIHYHHRPEYREKEDVAEDWRRKLQQMFVRKKYWYFVPLVRFLRVIPGVNAWLERNASAKRGRR